MSCPMHTVAVHHFVAMCTKLLRAVAGVSSGRCVDTNADCGAYAIAWRFAA
jgi:hypothetical protein